MNFKKKHNTLFFMVLLVVIFTANVVNAKNRIINGKTASIADYPWMVSLFIAKDNHTSGVGCGGSLIHSQWILTAAHCFLNEDGTEINPNLLETQTQVTLNSTTIDFIETDGLLVQSQMVVIHPDYNPNKNINDIALIKLENPITSIPPLTLIEGSSVDINPDTIVTVMGWGATRINNEGLSVENSNSLLEVDQKIISNEECSTIYRSGITDNMLCAGGITETDISDSCQGDSGGPIVIKKNNRFIQVGISSFGGVNKSCGEANIPGVYTKVSRFQSFIEQTISDGIDFTNINDKSNTTCNSTILKSNLNLEISCLIYQGKVYSTDLLLIDKSNFIWIWSGKLTPSNCVINTETCTTLDAGFNLTIHKIPIDGVNYTGFLQYDRERSQSSNQFWNYITHIAK